MIDPSDQEGERTGKNIKHRFAFSPTPQPASVTRTRSFKCTLRIRQGTGLNLPIAASTLANRVHFIRCSRDSGRFSWPFVGRRPIRDKAEALTPRGGADAPKTILIFDKSLVFICLCLAGSVHLSQAEVGGHENENEDFDHVTARGERSGCRAALLFWNWDRSGTAILCAGSGLCCALCAGAGLWIHVGGRLLGSPA